MSDLIPLRDIDYATVLAGARVPLCVSARSVERAEWIGDAAYAMQRGAMDLTRLVLTEANQQQLALDPSDPDTARVLDRRIAEARGYIDVIVAVLYIESGRFRLLVVTSEPRSDRPGLADHPALTDIDPTPANILTARAALVRALFPRTT